MRKFVFLFLTFTGQALAGWHSGGGELVSDELNPWWVDNTPRVEYCIDIDQVNFGQSLDVARGKIVSALSYWKGEFEQQIGGNVQHFKIATQNFVEVDCKTSPSLRFQLGTLDAEQAQYLKTPETIVGISVRTDYDPVSLRGKGFVYISPETGLYALTGTGSTGSLIPHRWSVADGKLLELVLTHELGHVFGLQHRNEGRSLMGGEFPASAISWPLAYAITKATSAPHYFGRETPLLPGPFYTPCASAEQRNGLWSELLGVPENYACVYFDPIDDKTIRISASRDLHSPKQFLGTGVSTRDNNTQGSGLVQLYVTSAQNLYSLPAGKTWFTFKGFFNIKVIGSFWYTEAATSSRRYLSSEVENDEMILTGVASNGEMIAFIYGLDWNIDNSRVPPQDPGAKLGNN